MVVTEKRKSTNAQQIVNCIAGFGGEPTADSRIAVPCPPDRNALRNPQRQLTSDRQTVQKLTVHCQ